MKPLARVAAVQAADAAAQRAGIPALAAMHEDNPGLEEAGAAPVIGVGATSREMKAALERLAPAVRKLAEGEPLTRDDGRAGRIPRRAVRADVPAAVRAVDLVLAHLGGDRERTEVPLPDFDRVTPAPPVDDPGQAVVALLTEGAVVPEDNPDKLESSRAKRWLRYSIDGIDSLPADQWCSVHGGFSTQWANEDPHRILPLDVARELEREGAIGRLHGEYLVTAGNGTAASVSSGRRTCGARR
jgi:glycine reductase